MINPTVAACDENETKLSSPIGPSAIYDEN